MKLIKFFKKIFKIFKIFKRIFGSSTDELKDNINSLDRNVGVLQKEFNEMQNAEKERSERWQEKIDTFKKHKMEYRKLEEKIKNRENKGMAQVSLLKGDDDDLAYQESMNQLPEMHDELQELMNKCSEMQNQLNELQGLMNQRTWGNFVENNENSAIHNRDKA